MKKPQYQRHGVEPLVSVAARIRPDVARILRRKAHYERLTVSGYLSRMIESWFNTR